MKNQLIWEENKNNGMIKHEIALMTDERTKRTKGQLDEQIGEMWYNPTVKERNLRSSPKPKQSNTLSMGEPFRGTIQAK